MGRIKFIECTESSYNDLPVKDSDTLYFLSDTKEIFKGENRYSGTTTLSDLGITSTATELNYTDGVKSSIQGQIDTKITYPTTTPDTGTYFYLRKSGSSAVWSEVPPIDRPTDNKFGGIKLGDVNGHENTFYLDSAGNLEMRYVEPIKVTNLGALYIGYSGGITRNENGNLIVERPVPAGGEIGQVLTKTSSPATSEFAWQTINIPDEITVDSVLSSTSENPVQNKVIKEAIDGKANSSHNHSAINIISGTLSIDRLPSIPDSKISGISASKISGIINSSNLPSYVDDVLEYNGISNFPENGESGKIYVDTSTNKTYRWGGSDYVEISASLALGETSSTAYRGDRGKTAYDHASAKGSAFASGLYKITTNAQGHVTNATAVTKSDITALGIPAQDTNTTYSDMKGATSGAAGTRGLVPAPASGASNRYLRSDGTWSVPPDTNTTYTLSSFGITATAAELNYVDGVTSNIQTQLNGKSPTSHTHSVATASVAGFMSAADKTKLDSLSNQDVDIWKTTKTAGEFYKASDAPTSTDVGKFDGYLYATRVYNAVWNDYAELFEKGEDIEFDHLAYVKEDGKAYSAGEPSNVVGIVTNNYGHLLGGDGDPDSEDYIPISLAGRVPVEVSEEIKVGDMVAANKNGTCRKATKEDFGCIVGKCIGSDPKNRENYVLVLVGMR